MLLAGGAMLMLLAAVGDAAHGILMFPILKRRGERLAVGYLGYRIVDAAFIGLWVLFLLLQIPLGREYLKAGGADPIYLQALSAVSLQASQYAYEIAMMFVGVAGVTLCYVLYAAGASSAAGLPSGASSATQSILAGPCWRSWGSA